MPQPLRALLLALLLAGLLLSACSRPGPDGQPADDPPAALEAPDGQAFAAFRGVAVAVPDDWGTEVFDGCGRTPHGTVVFRLPGRRHGCGQPLDRHRSWVVLEPVSRDDGPLLAMGRAGRVDGRPVRATGISCRSATACDRTLAVPSLGVLVQVHVHGDGARRGVRAVTDSLRLVPDGWTAVPPIPFGTSDARALAQLEETGLAGRIPEVDWPHYVTRSSPVPGTIVEEGSVVDLTIGDG